MAAQRVSLVFGGSGVIKALLDNPKGGGLYSFAQLWNDFTAHTRIVTVARNADKLTSMKQKFGNLPEDKLLIVEGNVGEIRKLCWLITCIATGIDIASYSPHPITSYWISANPVAIYNMNLVIQAMKTSSLQLLV